jgi:DNA-directed RNA polymerase specialized sigma24 family protein/ribosome-associated translation inhibitor RaiA
MNVHISYKAAKHPAVEHEIQTQLEKLERRLQVFRSGLVHLKGAVEHGSDLEGIVVALNLRLPSGQMAAHGHNKIAVVAVKTAFEDLRQQLNRHKEVLRDYRRVRRDHAAGVSQVPFEQTLAALHSQEVSADDIAQYVNTSLPRLRRFVERELAFREVEGELIPGSIAPEEVLDEAVLSALGDGHERPEKLAIEPWLYRLALHAIDALWARDGSSELSVPLEKSARMPNVMTGESQMQFHQPDECLMEEDIVADRRAPTPEESCASREWIALTESALRGLQRPVREAFLLQAVEGFSVDEVAAITGRGEDDIRTSVMTARARLRKLVPNEAVRSNHKAATSRRAS